MTSAPEPPVGWCASCGGAFAAHNRFCSRCGAPLPGHAPAVSLTKPVPADGAAPPPWPAPVSLTKAALTGPAPASGPPPSGALPAPAPGTNPHRRRAGLVIALAALVLATVAGAGIYLAQRDRDAASGASSSLAAPAAAPTPGQATELATPTPQLGSEAASPSPDVTDQGASVAAFYGDYFSAINNGDYDTLWRMLSPRLRGPSPAALAKGFASTQDSNIEVVSITPKSKGRVLAHVTFTSTQDAADGPDGDTCDNWDLDHLLAPSGDSWQIQTVSGHQGGPTHTTC